MIPLVDKPIIQYGVEEAIASGFDRVVIVTSRGKESIIEHFDRHDELERSLLNAGKEDLLEQVRYASNLASIVGVRQKSPRGLGHAVAAARSAVGDEAFAVSLPDDVILADVPCLEQMRRVFEEKQRPVIALMEVSREETSRYGIVACEPTRDGLVRITDMIEKPETNPPSTLAIIGRYILPPEIFEILDETEEGAGGEIQITDAIRGLIEDGDVYGLVFEGKRYDAGVKLGWLQATVEYALMRPEFSEDLRAHLERVLSDAES